MTRYRHHSPVILKIRTFHPTRVCLLFRPECLSRSAANCNHEIFTWTASFSPELTARSATHVTWVCCCCCCCCNSTCITMRPCQ